MATAPSRQFLLIDGDDTLWENNVYFEKAIEAFERALEKAYQLNIYNKWTLEAQSNLHSASEQVTVSLGGIIGRGVQINTSYTWQSARTQARPRRTSGRSTCMPAGIPANCGPTSNGTSATTPRGASLSSRPRPVRYVRV